MPCPVTALRALLTQLKPLLARDARLAWATKGFELDTGKLPHQVAYEVLGDRYPVAVLSGPTFAREVGMGLPTAMTIASPDAEFAAQLAKSLHASNFRAYTSTDIVGVEVGGAVKNVLAVGAGLSDGLGFGANTRIALITRGLSEVMRLGVALGAQAETFMGLAGLGDLVLTSTDNQSRNRRFGLALAAGKTVERSAERNRPGGRGLQRRARRARVALREKVDMPIVAGIYRVLYENEPAKDVVKDLMTRPIRSEARVARDGSARAGESDLAPGLVHRDGGGIREIQAAIAGAHRQRQHVLRRDRRQHLGWQPAPLRTEQQHIAGRETAHPRAAACAPVSMANQLPRQRGARRREVVVHVHGRQLVVVEAGAAHRLAIQPEAQRLDQVQLAPVLAASRIRLPVLGGISGSKMTMWNIARASVLQLERDADAAEAVVAVARELAAAHRGDGRGVECRRHRWSARFRRRWVHR